MARRTTGDQPAAATTDAGGDVEPTDEPLWMGVKWVDGDPVDTEAREERSPSGG